MNIPAFTTNEDFERYLLGGHGVITVCSKGTGKWFTYKMGMPKRPRNPASPPIFVSVLRGPQNTADYAFFGTIKDKTTISLSKRGPILPSSPSVRAFLWLFRNRKNPRLFSLCDIYHEGVCGCCGRRLTTPESIMSGIGPVCEARI